MLTRRLPGVRFEAQPPPLRDPLPRMDVAVFVGFAASGPLDCPVPVETPAQLAAIFGVEAALFRDEAQGERVSGHLAPAVRAFLHNGGRRCWVVRMADGATAQANLFPLPGLMQAELGRDGTVRAIGPAFARARSEGSWSDGLRAGAALTAQALPVLAPPMAPAPGELELLVAGEVRPGALLRLRYPQAGLIAICAIGSVWPADAQQPELGAALRVRGLALWFAPASAEELVDAVTATYYPDPVGRAVPLTAATVNGAEVELHLALALPEALTPGTLLRVDGPAGPIWILGRKVRAGDIDSPPQAGVLVAGPGRRWLERPTPPLETPLCELLNLELVAQAGDADPLRLGELEFVAGAARWWGALPTDLQLFELDASPLREQHAELWRAAASPRFPLAGPAAAGFSFPLGLGLLPAELLRPLPPAAPALRRDGLAAFSPALFLDPAFDRTLTADLLGRADYLRYLAPLQRRLRGIHAALAVEEATLIAVPDAARRAWHERHAQAPDPAQALGPLVRPEWWRFRGCAPELKAVREPEWGNFLDCAIVLVAAPALSSDAPDASGSFTLRWDASDPAVRYVLQAATRPDFADASTIYVGPETQHALYGRSPGDYYYHVRAVVGPNTSDWSPGLALRVGRAGGWATDAAAPAPDFALLAIHRALLRLCAARGDLLAVLSLPEHYREDDAFAHAAALRPARAPRFRSQDQALPLGFGEATALSYGALYHPWLLTRGDAGPLRREPPDGAACGIMARRAIARGAWIAPANERLSDVVALTPALSPASWVRQALRCLASDSQLWLMMTHPGPPAGPVGMSLRGQNARLAAWDAALGIWRFRTATARYFLCDRRRLRGRFHPPLTLAGAGSLEQCLSHVCVRSSPRSTTSLSTARRCSGRAWVTRCCARCCLTMRQ